MSSLKDLASLIMIPSLYKDGELHTVKPLADENIIVHPDATDNNDGVDGSTPTTSSNFTFSRGSNLAATRVDVNGLIEKGRENVVLHSNNFSNGVWPLQSATITSGQTGYDGSNDAWLLNSSAAGGNIRQGSSVSGVHTFSIYAKKGTADGIRVRFDQSTDTNVFVDLRDGSINTAINDITTSVQDVGSGWYRVTFAMLNAGLGLFRIYPTDGGTNAIVGTIYIQDAQLEQGLVATDYIETGTSAAQSGILEDMPRLDYSGGATCPALLLEPSRTNVITQSEYLSSLSKVSVGTASNPVTTANYALAPDGTMTATRVVFDLNGGTTSQDRSILRQSIPVGSDYYFSIYVKSANGNEQKVMWHDGGEYITKTATTEWERITYDARSGVSFGGIALNPNTGVDTSDILVWGFQVETGSYPTSYIPTYGTSQTRSNDAYTNSSIGASLSNGYTAFVECETLSTSEYNQIQFKGSGANYLLRIGNQVRVLSSSYVANNTSGVNKFALQVESTGNFNLFKNGSSIGTGSGVTFDLIEIKNDVSGSNVKQWLVFPTALTDSECIALTTL